MNKPSGYYRGPVVEHDPSVLSDDQIVKTFAPSMRVPWVVVTTLITAFTSVICTYFATKSGPIDCASRADLNAVSFSVGNLQKQVDKLESSVNHNADRANNDLVQGLAGMRTEMTNLRVELQSRAQK